MAVLREWMLGIIFWVQVSLGCVVALGDHLKQEHPGHGALFREKADFMRLKLGPWWVDSRGLLCLRLMGGCNLAKRCG